MEFLDVARIVAGLVLLVLGGELLVRGASALARRMGISSLVVGLTVVSAATSAPELAVTVGAVLRDEPGLAVGNVVGSNIVNVLLILGVSALVIPLAVKQRLVRFDVPVMVALCIALLLVSLDGRISAVDGLILFCAVIAHTVWTVVVGRSETRVPARGAVPAEGSSVPDATGRREEPPPPASTGRSLLLVVLGIAMLVAGATVLVEGAVNIATGLGVSSLVVGLTVVAVGTSLPELATSIIAVRRGERDLAVGNVVGSNIFNVGVVLGLPALISLEGIPVAGAAVAFDMPVMIAAALALLPVAFTGFAVARWEGALFVALYLAYTGYVVLAATAHDALAGFTAVMAWFVLPLVAVTLIAFTSYEVGLRTGQRDPRGSRPRPETEVPTPLLGSTAGATRSRARRRRAGAPGRRPTSRPR
ncbi:calcium/sodium antiporter [Cellulomonas sp. ATA003]|uniref:calcium/sodium antiporter n=1 Tax=Cellulomonas sp. ATA003 TaxID=3073064 RepID=UPI002873D6C1|nr:calcium/sodium antiporter [Cellulomonas sp. ATA003]WNB86486.1 calcium/sodium antiporter [Cellulomonas sp. ATA003]